MITTIPNYKRPYYLEIWRVDEIINIPNLLVELGFALSKNSARQMIKNGEVWWMPPHLTGRIDIRENMERVYENNIALEDLNILFVGTKSDIAMCHRIVFM